MVDAVGRGPGVAARTTPRAAPPDVTGDAAFTQLYSVTSFTFTFGANRRHASRDSFGSIDSNTNLTD